MASKDLFIILKHSELILFKDLPGSCLSIYLVIRKFKNGCWLSQDQIKEETGFCKATIKRCIKKLKAHGLIEYRRHWKRNLYQVSGLKMSSEDSSGLKSSLVRAQNVTHSLNNITKEYNSAKTFSQVSEMSPDNLTEFLENKHIPLDELKTDAERTKWITEVFPNTNILSVQRKGLAKVLESLLAEARAFDGDYSELYNLAAEKLNTP